VKNEEGFPTKNFLTKKFRAKDYLAIGEIFSDRLEIAIYEEFSRTEIYPKFTLKKKILSE
jgi:hypothetical protein